MRGGAKDNRVIARTGGDPRCVRLQSSANVEETSHPEKLETWRTGRPPSPQWRMLCRLGENSGDPGVLGLAIHSVVGEGQLDEARETNRP